MRGLQSSVYKIGRKAAVSETFAAVAEAITTAGGDPAPALYLEDMPVGFTSGIDRLLKRFPELLPFAIARSDSPERVLTNLGPSWIGLPEYAPTGRIPLEAAAAVAAGIPRTFPMHYVSFVWPNVPALGDAYDLPLPPSRSEPRFAAMHAAPGVVFCSHWWKSGRLNSLVAYTEVRQEERAGASPVVPQAAATLLASLGKVQQTLVVPIVEPADEQRVVAESRRLQEAIARFHDDAASLMAGLPYPHDLPPLAEVVRTYDQKIGSMKGVLVDVFGPAGYSYRSAVSGRGFYQLEKVTSGGSTLELSFDVGIWSRSCTATLLWRGLRQQVTLRLPVSRRAAGAIQYPITNLAQFRQIAENVAVVVREIEHTLVPAAERATSLTG